MSSSLLVRKALEYGRRSAKSGMSTLDLNNLISNFVLSRGGSLPCIGYQGYSYGTCISVNEEICHGLPSATKTLEKEDVVKLDLVVKLGETMSDSATTFVLEGRQKRPEIGNLLRANKKALRKAILLAKAGTEVGALGAAIEKSIVEDGFFVISEFMGHAIGKEIHELPYIKNIANDSKFKLVSGMRIAIEPLIALLPYEEVTLLPDGHTYSLQKGNIASHFEATITIP